MHMAYELAIRRDWSPRFPFDRLWNEKSFFNVNGEQLEPKIEINLVGQGCTGIAESHFHIGCFIQLNVVDVGAQGQDVCS